MIFDRFSATYVGGRCFVSVTFPYNRHDALLVENLRVEENVEYIRANNIKKAFINFFPDFEFLRQCPSLKHIVIDLRLPFRNYSQLEKTSKIQYDFTPVSEMDGLLSVDIRDNERPESKAFGSIDISKMTSLQSYIGEHRFTKNLSSGVELRTLSLLRYKQKDLSEFSAMTKLDTLQLQFSRIETLQGCENLPRLQCLYLAYNRSLTDISALESCAQTLRALRLESCCRIQDFSVLASLKNLELLEITGSLRLPNLDFIRQMPSLKTFIFSATIEDGDLSPCDNLEYVHYENGHRYYNRRSAKLPKGEYYRGNDTIPEWRRME